MAELQMAPFKDGGKHPFPILDIHLPYRDTYNGNILIKKAYTKSELNIYHKIEIAKCKLDPVYFIENYCRIVTLDDGIVPFKMYDYQKQMVKLYQENRFCLTLTARQMGKTAAMAAYILWFAIFHETKTVAVLANKMEQAQEIMDRIRMAFEYLPFFLQHGVKVYNKRRLEFDNGSIIFSSATSASGIRGRTVDLCYIDEAAFVENDLTFYESTYPVITSGKESRMIMTTTPRGARGMFYMLWREAKENRNFYKTIEVLWNHHPKRDEKWKEETIANIGYSRFAQEFACKFQGSAGTLIPAHILERLQWLNAINDDESLKIYQPYVPGRKYVAIADPGGGVGIDYSVCTIIDVETYPYRVVAKYRNNEISPMLFPHTIMNMAVTYGNCPVLVEANNDVGGQVTYILYYELEYENVVLTSHAEKAIGGLRIGGKATQVVPGVKTTKKVKSIGCSNLKTLLENNDLIIEDQEMIEELGTFIVKGSSFEADEDCHDDTVMTLVLFSWFVKQEYFNEYANSNIGDHLYKKNVEMALEDILPFGHLSTQEQELTVTHVETVAGFSGITVTEGHMSFEEWMRL